MERKADWLPAVSSNVRALSECCDLSEAGHHFGYRNLSIARLLDDGLSVLTERERASIVRTSQSACTRLSCGLTLWFLSLVREPIMQVPVETEVLLPFSFFC